MPSAVFSVAEALELGQFVLAAYDLYASGDPPAFSPPEGYSLVTKLYADDLTDGLPDYFVFGYIARKGSDAVVAVRGTERVLEWIRNIEFTRVVFPYAAAGRTERGFTDFYSSLRTGPGSLRPRAIDALKTLLADGSVTSLRIAGHSLGSALAAMLALDVAANKIFTNPVVYTFASPRVGDKVFAGSYDALIETSWRIANLNDVVPQLPPMLAGYVHVDAELPINSDDRTKHSFLCWHELRTYLHTLDASVALDPHCPP